MTPVSQVVRSHQHMAALLGMLLVFSILTSWVTELWAFALFEAGAGLLAAVYLARWTWQDGQLYTNKLLLPLAAFPALGLLQLLTGTTMYRFATLRETLQWATYLAVFFLSLQFLAEPRIQKLFRSTVLYGCTAFSAFSIVQQIMSKGKIFWAWEGYTAEAVFATFWNRNHYAALIELFFPIAVVSLLQDMNRLRYVWITGLIFASVVISGSRTGIILMVGEFAVLWSLGYPSRRTRLGRWPAALGMAFASLLVIVFIAWLLGGTAWQRFQEIGSSEPYVVRLESARMSLAMIRKHPAIGVGLGAWPSVYRAFAAHDTGFSLLHSDNDWLEWTAEGGFPFLLLLLVLACGAIRYAVLRPWSMGTVIILIHSLGEFPLQKQALMCCMLVLLAAAASAGTAGCDRQHQSMPGPPSRGSG